MGFVSLYPSYELGVIELQTLLGASFCMIRASKIHRLKLAEETMIKAVTRTSTLFAAVVALGAFLGAAAPAQADGAERCIRASQCHGPLPQICERCSNGTTACAHHVCVHHRCGMQICG